MPSYVTHISKIFGILRHKPSQTNINHPTNWNIDHWLHISRPGYTFLQRVQRNISDHLPRMLFSNQCHLEAPDGKKDEEKSASRSGEKNACKVMVQPPKKVEMVQTLQRSREDCCLSGRSSLNLHAFCYLFFVKLYQYWNPESGDTRTTNSIPTEKTQCEVNQC